jgi:undecaprenyl-diphosphatase
LIELDARLTQRLRIAERPGILRRLAAILAHSGDSWVWMPGLLLLWWLGNNDWKSRALILVTAMLIAATIVFLVKLVIRRKRPEGEWGKFYRSTDPHSFPSGHSVRAMMVAVIMLGLGPWWVGVMLLAWAPLVGLARVGMGLHYLSDVLAGLLMGLVIGGLILLVF